MPMAFVLNALFTSGVAAQAALRPLLIGLGVAAITMAVAVAALRHRHAGALAVGGAELVLLTAPAWLILPFLLGQGELLVLALLIIPLAGIGVLLVRLARRHLRGVTWPQITGALNLLAGLTLLVVIVTGAARGAVAQVIDDLAGDRSEASTTDGDGSAGPDVVVLLLDGYPRADTLRRVLDFDNWPFLGELEALGFEVAARSRSNYAWTQLTMASMLHGCHVQQLDAYAAIAQARVPENPTMRNLLNRNPVFEQFRESEYRVVTLSPGIERITLHEADDHLHDERLSEFEYHLLRSTALDRLLWAIDPSFILGQHRERVLWGLDTVERVASEPSGGRLILAHYISPHMPAVFRADGSLRVTSYTTDVFVDRRASTDATVEDWTGPYRDQLGYLNERLIGVIDAVVAGNPDAFVIVLSDHGSAVEWRDDTLDTDHDERHATLFAARTPGFRDLFTDDQTPVNLFPPIMNALLDADVALQPNLTFAGLFDLVEIENPDRVDSGSLGSAPACLASRTVQP